MLEESETAGTTVWDTATGEILARLNDGMTDAIAWHPHDDLLATAASSIVRISRSDGEVLWTLSGHRVNTRWRTFDIKDLAFHPDGHQLASLSTDGTVRLWSLDGGTCTPSPRAAGALREAELARRHGGRIAVSGGKSRGLELWDAELTESSFIGLPEFIPDVGAPGELGRTAWGPDGTLYAVARWWGVIAWDGREWRPFELP